MTQPDKNKIHLSRRDFLTASTALTVAAGTGISLATTSAQAAIKSNAHIVVVGYRASTILAGSASITLAG